MAENNEELSFARSIARASFDPAVPLTEDQKEKRIKLLRWEHLNKLGQLFEGAKKVIIDPYAKLSRGTDDGGFPEVAIMSMFHIDK